MEEDDVLRQADKAIWESKKVIADAEAALRRTDDYFRDQGLSPEMLNDYLEKHSSPTIRREIELMVEQTMKDIREEADAAIRESQQVPVKAPPRGRFRTMI